MTLKGWEQRVCGCVLPLKPRSQLQRPEAIGFYTSKWHRCGWIAQSTSSASISLKEREFWQIWAGSSMPRWPRNDRGFPGMTQRIVTEVISTIFTKSMVKDCRNCLSEQAFTFKQASNQHKQQSQDERVGDEYIIEFRTYRLETRRRVSPDTSPTVWIYRLHT